MRRLKPLYLILLFCLAGSAIRILFGFLFHPWNQSPDQIAWGILLEGKHFSYDQLIHYPYEGGSILISLLCHFIQLFTNFNSLTIAAILLDFVSRFIQLYIVRKIFNDRIFFFFAAWTIFTTPSLIPWGTVNFGLHSLSSFFPFLLLYLIWKSENTKKDQIRNGIFLGLAFWFSYSNFVLIPVYFIYQFVSDKKDRLWIYSLFSLSIILALHFLVRHFSDAGFHLQNSGITSIRGINFSFPDIHSWKRIVHIWNGPLADSSLAIENPDYLLQPLKYLWLIFVLIGIGSCVKSILLKESDRKISINLLTVFLFLLVYALSPFYAETDSIGNFISYRHLAYIIPFLVLLVITGIDKIKFKTILLSLFLLLSIYNCVLLFTGKPSYYVAEKEAGWVLGQKLGHDPERLYKIISNSHYNKDLLLQGTGWGISSVSFEKINVEDSSVIENKIKEVIQLVNRFPDESRKNSIEGIIFSFNKGITPVLDKRILIRIENEFSEQGLPN